MSDRGTWTAVLAGGRAWGLLGGPAGLDSIVRAGFSVRAGRSLGSSLACWTPKRSAHECHTATTVAHEGDACTLWCAWRAPSGCVSVRVPDPRSALAVGNRCGFLAVQGVGDSMTSQPCTVVRTPASIITGCECVEGGCGARPLGSVIVSWRCFSFSTKAAACSANLESCSSRLGRDC